MSRQNNYFRDKRFARGRDVRHDLKNIYNESGSNNNAYRLEPRRKRGALRFLIILGVVLLVLIGVAWAGSWVFNKYAPDRIKAVVGDYGQVELKIEAPQEIDSGNEVIYVINYSNKKKIALNEASLNLQYPTGLLVSSIEPAPTTKENGGENKSNVKEESWELGRLEKGASGKIEIKGRLIAEAGSSQTVFATLYYKPENISSKSQFSESASGTVFVKSAPVSLTVDGPSELATADSLELTLKYENKNDQDLNNIQVEMDYPDGFEIEKVEPAAKDKDNNIWPITTLKSGDKGEIKIKGKFAANIAGSQDFIAKILISEEGSDYLPIAEATHTINVITVVLSIELKVNSSVDNSTANFGDILSYSLTYENTGKDTLSDSTATVFLSPLADFIDWATLTDRYDGTIDDFEAGKSLTWTGEEVPNLAELKPGEKGVIDFTVKISSDAAKLAGDLTLQSIASIKIGKIGTKEVNVESRSNKVVTTLNSNLNLSAVGRYFDSNVKALGSGPLPPKVGEKTTYVIIWKLSNSVHEVNNITVSTTLPSGVSFEKNLEVAAGDLEYQPAARRVVWTLNRMPLNMDINYQVSFEVSIMPVISDKGKILALTGDSSSLTAVDSVTGAKITQSQKAITTDLVDDPVAKGKGLVE